MKKLRFQKKDKETADADLTTTVESIENIKAEQSVTRRRNITTMVLCVVVAFIIWFYVMEVDSPIYEETFSSVPVSIMTTTEDGTENGLSAISGTGNVVEVTLRGRRSVLSALKSSDINAYIDASAVTNAGRATYTITVEAPTGTVVDDYFPKEASVYLDRKTTKTVPVSVKLSDYTIASEFILGDRTPSVESVIVTGPESELKTVEGAQITLAVAGSITGSISGSAAPELIDKDGNIITSRFLSINESEISATVSVYMYKYLDLDISYKYGYLGVDNARLTFSPEKLYVKGNVETLQNLDTLTIGEIDETRVSKTDAVYHFTPVLPEGVTMAESVDSVDVNLQLISAYDKTVIVDNIKVLSAPNGKIVAVLTNSLSVRLRGTLEAANAVKEDDITVMIDLKNLDSDAVGEQYVPATVTLRGGSSEELYVLDEYTILVRID